jgi:NTP pyrophosphatase (non-canonical NTP hydrolase)
MVDDNRSFGENYFFNHVGERMGIAGKANPTSMPDINFTVTIPGECAQYAHDIRRFVDAMIFKLEKNIDKGRWESYSVEDAFHLLQKETQELFQELGGNSMKVVMEAADVANFAMIVASIAIERNR